MMNLAACFCFWTSIIGIYGYQVEFEAGVDEWEPFLPNSSDDFSTEQQIFTSENTLPSTTEDISSSSSSEYPVTLDPYPSRPLHSSYYPEMRKYLLSMAKRDYLSKMVFNFYNRPSEMRGFIDGIFYSLELYRKGVKDRAYGLGEAFTNKGHVLGVDQLNEEIEQNTEDDEIYAKPSFTTAESTTSDPSEEAGLHFNSKVGVLRRSGVLAEVVKDVGSKIGHSPEDTPMEVPTEEEYSTAESSKYDDAFSSATTYDTPVVIPEDATVYPEFSHKTKHFTEDWSRTLFPPVKSKIVVRTEIDEPTIEQIPYVYVSEVHKSKSAVTSEQAAYIASEAVEGSLGLAETIARETALLVNRIVMEALKRNTESHIAHGHLKHRIPKTELNVIEKKPYY